MPVALGPGLLLVPLTLKKHFVGGAARDCRSKMHSMPSLSPSATICAPNTLNEGSRASGVAVIGFGATKK